MNHFERFWSIYPRKVAKGQASKTWAKLVKGMSETEESEFADLLVGAVRSHINNRKELENTKQFVPPWKHPTTWLNGECWNDELKSIQEIREESNHDTSCCECGITGPYKDRGWIVREKTYCTPCYSKTYEDGPTGLKVVREALASCLKRIPRTEGESWAEYHKRVYGSGKTYGLGNDKSKVAGPDDVPEYGPEDVWQAG